MTINWKIIIPIAAFLGGLWIGKGRIETVEKIVTVKGETVTVVVEKIVTVTKTVLPDGTVTESTTTAETSTNQNQSTETVDSSSESRPVANEWGVGGGVIASLKNLSLTESPDLGYYVTGSRRIIGDAWVDLTVNTDRQVAAGVRIEF